MRPGDVESANGRERPKAKIFISYSRRDAFFADRLDAGLKSRSFDPLIDRAEIYALEDWWKRIESLIVKADTIVFVISPDAVSSEICQREVKFAASLSKRLAPVVCRRVEDKAVPEELARLNFIFFDDEANFNESMNRLADALETDIDWIRKHTELGELARRWSEAGQPKPRGLLLRSPMLEEAERWIAARPSTAPTPTGGTQAFIAESRRAATQRRNIVTGSLAAGLVVALGLAGLAAWQRNIAETQRDRAERTLSQIIATANRRVVALSVNTNPEEKLQNSKTEFSKITKGDNSNSIPEVDLKRASDLLDLSSSFFSRDDALAAFNTTKKALLILDGQAGSHQDLKWQQSLVEACERLAKAAARIGEHEQARAALQRGVQIAENLTDANPGNISLLRLRASSEQSFGSWLLTQDKIDEANIQYQQALIVRKSIATIDASLDVKRELADIVARIGDLFLAKGNAVEAIDHYKQSVGILDELMKGNRTNDELARDQSANYQHIADALRHAGNNSDAVSWINLDLEIAERLSASNRENPLWQHDLASSLDRLAEVQGALGKLDSALTTYQKSLAILEALVALTPRASGWQRDVAAVREAMGKLLVRQQRVDEAVDVFRQSLSTREALAASFEEKSWQSELEAAYRRASEVMLRMGRPQDALETSEQYLLATALSPESGNDKPGRVARALGTLCWSALFAGNISRSVWAGYEGTLLAPDVDWIKINYAHSLMFSGEIGSAKEIYLSGIKNDSAAASAWKQTIRNDFAELRKKKMTNDLMTDVSNRLGL